MIISIEGNIGSGKSTFLSYLKSNNNKYVFVKEPVDEWESVCDTESGKSIIEKLAKYNYFLQDKKEDRKKALDKVFQTISPFKIMENLTILKILHKSNKKIYNTLNKDLTWIQQKYLK
jgi:dephospho-CoA kinase